MKIFSFLLIHILFCSTGINAHELWIEANDYNNQEKLAAHIKVGQNLIGESYPFINEETEKLILQTRNNNKLIKQYDGDYPAIQQNINKNELGYLYYQSNKVFLEYENKAKFKEFIDEYDLKISKIKSNQPTEIYQRFAKIIFNYKNNRFYVSKSTLDFEIINLNNPASNNKAQIKIVLDNQPFKNKTFLVFYKNKQESFFKKNSTDSDGFANIDISKRGLYLISAVDLKKTNSLDKLRYKSNFFSRWASLTFFKD